MWFHRPPVGNVLSGTNSSKTQQGLKVQMASCQVSIKHLWKWYFPVTLQAATVCQLACAKILIINLWSHDTDEQIQEVRKKTIWTCVCFAAACNPLLPVCLCLPLCFVFPAAHRTPSWVGWCWSGVLGWMCHSGVNHLCSYVVQANILHNFIYLFIYF